MQIHILIHVSSQSEPTQITASTQPQRSSKPMKQTRINCKRSLQLPQLPPLIDQSMIHSSVVMLASSSDCTKLIQWEIHRQCTRVQWTSVSRSKILQTIINDGTSWSKTVDLQAAARDKLLIAALGSLYTIRKRGTREVRKIIRLIYTWKQLRSASKETWVEEQELNHCSGQN